MSKVITDANVDIGVVSTDHGDVPVVLLNAECHNRVTDEAEEVPLVLTVRDANTLGQLLITITNNININNEAAEGQQEEEPSDG